MKVSRKRIAALLAAWCLAGMLSACGGQVEEPASRQIFAMDTAMALTVYGAESSAAVQAAEEELMRLEALLSRTSEDSPVTALNRAGGRQTVVGEELSALLDAAGTYSGKTGGAFDPTIAPVVLAWGFTTGHNRVPAPEEVASLLETVGMEHVHLDGGTAWMAPETQIDLGGIGKGYASDRMAEIFSRYEIPRATAALGGNVLAWGTRPDGTPWRVGVQDPRSPEDSGALACLLHLEDAFAVTSGGYQRHFEAEGQSYHHIIDPATGYPAQEDSGALACLLHLEDAFAVTSGGYQRHFEAEGQSYHHIIDPATGYPAQSGLTSVTVVADCRKDGEAGLPGNGTMCDALSTALFVMGEEKALDFWRTSGLEVELVLVTEDGRVVVTKGLAELFEEIEESGYRYEIVS